MSILDQAAIIVDGNREAVYGPPSKNLTTIAAFWAAWLSARGRLAVGATVTAEDVACMMALLKLARLSNNIGHQDSMVDACGYIRLLERCSEVELPSVDLPSAP